MKSFISAGILGSGRMAKAVAHYLTSSELRISGIWARNMESADKISTCMGLEVFRSIEDATRSSDILLVAVKDDALEEILMEVRNAASRDSTIVYFSGCLGLSRLENLPGEPIAIVNIHPLMTVPDVFVENPLTACPCGVSASSAKLETSVMDWLRSRGHRVFNLPPTDRPLYHAAAVFSCAGVTELVNSAAGIMALELNIAKEDAVQLLLPLISRNLEFFRDQDEYSPTGPWSRSDVATAQKHREAISSVSTNILKLYDSLADIATHKVL